MPLSASSLARGQLLAGLVFAGFVNGTCEKLVGEVAENGFLASLFRTFDISIVVWFGAAASIALLARAPSGAATRRDMVVGAVAALTFLAPVPSLSWLGITAVALHLIAGSQSRDALRRSGAILLALTVPLFWARAVFALFSNQILELDAKLIGWIVGTGSIGNMIPFANGAGVVFLQPACSSITNLSLAIVCGVLFVELQGARWTRSAALATAAAAAATVLINVTRIATIALMPEHYSLLHGPAGSSAASWLTVAAIAAILAYGIRREPAVR